MPPYARKANSNKIKMYLRIFLNASCLFILKRHQLYVMTMSLGRTRRICDVKSLAEGAERLISLPFLPSDFNLYTKEYTPRIMMYNVQLDYIIHFLLFSVFSFWINFGENIDELFRLVVYVSYLLVHKENNWSMLENIFNRLRKEPPISRTD